jgi:hypothetical protein
LHFANSSPFSTEAANGRIFVGEIVLVSKLRRNWREVLIIVKPETVVKWHKEGFRLYWRRKSEARRVGRPQIDKDILVINSRI